MLDSLRTMCKYLRRDIDVKESCIFYVNELHDVDIIINYIYAIYTQFNLDGHG